MTYWRRCSAAHRDDVRRLLISLTRDIDLADDLLRETYLYARVGCRSVGVQVHMMVRRSPQAADELIYQLGDRESRSIQDAACGCNPCMAGERAG